MDGARISFFEVFPMTQRSFTISCLMAGGLLVKFGAPFPAVAAGMALAGLWSWKRDAIARLIFRS